MRAAILGIVILATFHCHAADLNGRLIQFKGTEVTSRWVPLTLPFEGEAPAGKVFVEQPNTGNQFPAMVRNGEFVFISEGSTPGMDITYRVEIEPKMEGDLSVVQAIKREGEDIVDILIEDKLFTSYHYGKNWKKPFLWPINGEDGLTLTRDYPMEVGDTPKFAQDHPHHKSIWTAYGDVNGVDFWAEGEGSGNQVAQEVTFGSGDAYGWVHSKNVWQKADGTPVISETREYRFYATPEKNRLFDVSVTFTAANGDTKFGDTKEGGLVSLRMRPELSYKAANITIAGGETGESKVWGKPAPWCDYSGEMENVGWRGIALFDNPKNMRYPTSWHVRQYGLNGANAFGYSYFREAEYNKDLPENGDFQLKNGESFTMNYRVYVHSGDVERARVGDRYTDYATPPKVDWVE